MAQVDESNPFAALVAQAPKTVLDSHREHTQTKPQQNDPVIAFDGHSPDEDVPITLKYRQPSFSSLDGENLRTKDDQVVGTILMPPQTEDPVIVFDSKSGSDQDDSPITLSVRQPSFSSLSERQLVPKGGDDIKNFVPVIEEVNPTPAPVIEQEDDPQVQLVQELRARNEPRWEKIGYEPPADLIPHVRAASQTEMRQTPNIVDKGRSNSEVGKRPDNLQLGYNKGSCEMMEEVIQEEPEPIKEMSIEEYDEKSELGNMTERLAALVDKDWLRVVLATGDIKQHESVEEVRAELKKLADLTADRYWIEETEYIHELLANTQMLSPKTARRLGFVRADVNADIERMQRELEELEEEREKRAEELRISKEKALAELEQEYLAAAKELDEMYEDPEYLQSLVKPSNKLLDLRVRTKRSLKAKKADQARELTKDVELEERHESERAQNLIQDRYYLEDQNMKEEFASRREIILEKHQHILDRLNSEIQARSDIIHLQIAKLKAQFTPTETDNTKNITSPTMKKGSQTPSFLDTGCIRVSPPQLRNRTNDIKLITEMSEAMHEQRSPRRGYNDQKLKL